MGNPARIIGPQSEYRRIKSGYTYFLQCRHSSVVKVGYSVDPIKRFKALRSSSFGNVYGGYAFEILFVINDNVENRVHRNLRDSKTRETYLFHGITPLEFANWLIKPRGRWWDMELFNREVAENETKNIFGWIVVWK